MYWQLKKKKKKKCYFDSYLQNRRETNNCIIVWLTVKITDDGTKKKMAFLKRFLLKILFFSVVKPNKKQYNIVSFGI